MISTKIKDDESYILSDNPIIQKKNRYKNYNISLIVRTFERKDILVEEYKSIAELCDKNSISFLIREYNSRVYEEDSEYITRLPAFHIYEGAKKRYVGTFYEGTDPLQIINNDTVEKISFFKRILNLFHRF